MIVSSHTPQDEESKKLEFDNSDFGMLGLQTFLPIIINKLNGKDISGLIEKFTINPRTILNLAIPKIEEGAKADLTIFDPDLDWLQYNL